jgi:dihydrofolate reductase
MARLVYSVIASLDGYINDESGGFTWAAPDAEVHAFVNDLEREAGTYLYGRRLYETMLAWETMDDPDPVMRDYAQLWRAADKIVYSTGLENVASERTRLERAFDPAAVRELADAADRPVSIGGPTLAAHALRAGIVDELRLLAHPVIVGGGTPWLPDGLRLDLRLLDQRRFERSGVVYTSYAAR